MRSSGRKECAFEGCDRVVKSKGYCNGHYQQHRSGKELKPLRSDSRARNLGRKCAYLPCSRDAICRGLCDGHYQQRKAGKELSLLQSIHEFCSIEGCSRAHAAKGYCTKHYERWRAGKDPAAPSRKDPSIIEDRGDHLGVSLGGKWAKKTGRLWAQVDRGDRAVMEGRSWWMNNNGYVAGKVDGERVLLHRYLLGLGKEDSRQGDHIDGDPLNNRSENLRPVTHKQNMQNKKVWGKSGHRNVYQHPINGTYKVIVIKDGKRHSGGRFKDVALAVAAAQELRDRLFSHHNEERASSE
jgi:hypothetical protein